MPVCGRRARGMSSQLTLQATTTLTKTLYAECVMLMRGTTGDPDSLWAGQDPLLPEFTLNMLFACWSQ